ncbi:hypothetical protein EVAR_50905_1 [Eumeta japonica]|uniref:Uncharacterized protein n=1 Tax=Eumeta variegata TaxID=151549 RepID=A0A4C1YB77_EUMVA|nr:hypothetical protein EVAR_50905_1 [Eumeta japonica]
MRYVAHSEKVYLPVPDVVVVLVTALVNGPRAARGQHGRLKYNARNSAALNSLRMIQCANPTLPDSFFSPPHSRFRPLRCFRHKLHSGRVSCVVPYSSNGHRVPFPKTSCGRPLQMRSRTTQVPGSNSVRGAPRLVMFAVNAPFIGDKFIALLSSGP